MKTSNKSNLEYIFDNTKVSKSQPLLRSYASDAGFYKLMPEAVVYPDSVSDIVNLYNWCKINKKYLNFRAGGTSLSGQSQTDGILADISRGWNLIDPDITSQTVRVQPGARCGKINDILRKYGMKLGPDPASVNSCLAGGMLANNSSGMRSGIDKNPYNTLVSAKFILPEGLQLDSSDRYSDMILKESLPELFHGLLDLREQILNDSNVYNRILNKYSIKNTIGYSVNAFIDYSDPVSILTHLMIGSEGTLGFISEAVLKVYPDLQHRFTGLLFFRDIRSACSSVRQLKDSGASVIELMDYNSLLSVRNQAQALNIIDTLTNTTAAILFEYEYSDKAALETSKPEIKRLLESIQTIADPIFAANEAESNLLWKIRQGLLPSLATTRDPGTTVIIEDVAFPADCLADAVCSLQTLLKEHGYTKTGIYGHAADGNIHFMIAQSFANDSLLSQYDRFTEELVELVTDKFGGSLKAEHGTGRSMAPFVEKEWGSEIYEIMRSIKHLCDPHNISNPGVVINDDRQVHLKNIKHIPNVDPKIDKCMECGFCEPKCPSRNLTLSPRKRIAILRDMEINKQNDIDLYNEVLDDFQYSGLDTCAVDGLCATVCPAGINTGDLVKDLREKNTTNFSVIIANFISMHFAMAESILKFLINMAHAFENASSEGTLASLTRAAEKIFGLRVPKWNKYLGYPQMNLPGTQADADFVYFPCCMSRMLGKPGINGEPGLSEIVEYICKSAGKKISVPESITGLCCGMAYSSKGYNEAFALSANKLVEALWTESKEGLLPVIFDSSSCAYTFRNYGKGLSDLNLKKWQNLKLLDSIDLISDYLIDNLNLYKMDEIAVLHPNCSAQKMGLTEKMRQIAAQCASEVFLPISLGCCGFAGDRGLLIPELNQSAAREETDEIKEFLKNCNRKNVGFYSTNTTCETGMSSVLGSQYSHILYLVYQAIKESESRLPNN